MAKRKTAPAPKPKTLPGITVTKDDTGPELLAKSIVDVAESARELLNSRLSRRAILVLIYDMCSGVNRTQIAAVLDAAASLDATFTKR